MGACPVCGYLGRIHGKSSHPGERFDWEIRAVEGPAPRQGCSWDAAQKQRPRRSSRPYTNGTMPWFPQCCLAPLSTIKTSLHLVTEINPTVICAANRNLSKHHAGCSANRDCSSSRCWEGFHTSPLDRSFPWSLFC